MRAPFAILLTLTAATALATPLHDAARDGDIDKIQMLLSSRADRPDPNATASNEEIGEITALHLAAEADHLDTVTVLLQAGADRHARDGKARTPLNIAVARGHTGTIRALLEGTDDEPTISFDFKHPLVTVSIKGVQRSDLYDEETKVMLKRAAELAAWSAKQLQSQVKR